MFFFPMCCIDPPRFYIIEIRHIVLCYMTVLSTRVLGLFVCLFFFFIIFLTCTFVQIFRIFMRINVRVLFVILLLALGVVFYIGASTSPVIVFVFSICIISFLLSMHLAKWVLAKDEGPPEMGQVQLPPMSFCL